MGLAENIKKLREKANISCCELARQSGLNVWNITKIENGKTKNPRIDTLQKLAEKFEISVEELLK